MSSVSGFFGAAVRRHRERLGLSQEAFADRAGIHRTYVSSIELGKVQVSIGVAQQLAETLGIPLSKIWREIEKKLSKKKTDPAAES
jgi:transcriptional regulator with XRE-family HTH domain